MPDQAPHCVVSFVRYISLCERGRCGDESAAPPGGKEGKLRPYRWTSKNYVICVCFHCHGTSSYHTTKLIHCKAVELRATLIHRQYNRDWGTSYARPPIDPYLTPPPPVTKSWRRHCLCPTNISVVVLNRKSQNVYVSKAKER